MIKEAVRCVPPSSKQEAGEIQVPSPSTGRTPFLYFYLCYVDVCRSTFTSDPGRLYRLPPFWVDGKTEIENKSMITELTHTRSYLAPEGGRFTSEQKPKEFRFDKTPNPSPPPHTHTHTHTHTHAHTLFILFT